MIEITYYAKEIKSGNDERLIARQYAGATACPNCGGMAVVVNDCPNDDPKMWSIECGRCDYQIYGVKVVDCSDDSNEGYYELFPDECPCSLCSNEEPDNEYCWRAGYYVADVVKTHRITMHISASASQEASCDVPMAVIKEGRQAVWEYIISNDDTDYTDYDHDNLDNEGFSWTTHDSDVARALPCHENYISFSKEEE